MQTKRNLSYLWILLIFSVAGFFCRSYQLRFELLPNGSLQEGAFMHTVLLILTILFLVSWVLLLRRLSPMQTHAACFPPCRVMDSLQMLAAVGLLVGNGILWVNGSESASQYTAMSVSMAKWLPILGLLSGACLLAFALLCLKGKKPSPLLYMCASIYLVVRLIVAFQEWNTDPSVHDYAYQLLAAICCMLGSFQLAGFGFDKGKRRMTLFWTLGAVYFCAISTADALGNAADCILNLSLLLTMAVSSVRLLLPAEEST